VTVLPNLELYNLYNLKSLVLLAVIGILIASLAIVYGYQLENPSTTSNDRYIPTIELPNVETYPLVEEPSQQSVNLADDVTNLTPNLLNAKVNSDWQGLTAKEIIGRYKKGMINKEFPGQFYDKTIEFIQTAAAKGDREAKKAMKLLTNKRFDKEK